VLRADLDKITEGQGDKVMTQLVATYFFYCKAWARDWLLYTLFIYYTKVLVANTDITNNMSTAATTPFGMKTLWGALSDAVPCLGYHKRFYIVWGVSVNLVCLICLAVFFHPIDFQVEPASITVISLVTLLFFGAEYGNATVDSLSQAMYTEYMKKLKTPTIVSFVWFLIQVSGLISSMGNLVLDQDFWQDSVFPNNPEFALNIRYKILLYLAVPACLPILVPASLNWLLDPPGSSFCSVDMSKVTKHSKLFFLSMFLAIGSIIGALLLIFEAQLEAALGHRPEDGRGPGIFIRLIFYSSFSLAFVPLSFWVLPGNIAKPAFYMFLCSTFRLFFSGTLQGFYTFPNNFGRPAGAERFDCSTSNDSETCQDYCLADSPGFSISYFQFVGSFVGAIASVTAVYIFEKSVSKWNVRPAFWVTTVFQMCSCCIEITMLERWNHRIFGTTPGADQWPDNMFFLIGTQALDKIIEMLDFMPCNILIGKLCPPKMEATIFAVLAGSQNFGTTLARVFGGLFVEYLGVTFRAGTANIPPQCENPYYTLPGTQIGLHGLSVARFMGGFILPALTIPFTFCFLPDKLLTDDFVEGEERDVELMREEGQGSASAAGGSFAASAPLEKQYSVFSTTEKTAGFAAAAAPSLASLAVGGGAAAQQRFL